MSKMSKNKTNFIIGIIGSGIIFVTGVLYLIIPSYYGIDNMENIDTNNLFLSMMLIFASVHLGEYYLIGKNPNNETIAYAIIACLVGIFNTSFSSIIGSNITLSISLLLLVISLSIAKLFTVDYYHDRKDAFYYIEGLLLIMFLLMGLVASISLYNDPILQTVILGFFFIVDGMIEIISVTTKCLLKAPRFLGKIKF